jgi:SAM-dependent methyltransferase
MSKRDERPEEQDGTSTVDGLMTSQIAYYRAHAPKYDDWWFRERRHDLGEGFRRKWESEISTLQAKLPALAPFGEVLEFAGGTGNWTAELTPLANAITVVDSSPQAAAIARGKVADGNVIWIIEDIFNYSPQRQYDTVFFSFWLSHVPPELFDPFWALVAECLAPGGQVIFIDNAHPSLASDVPELSPLRSDLGSTSIAGIDSVTDLATGISTRLAADGSTYELVKIWRTADELETRLKTLGWTFQVATTEWAFILGHGSRTEES